MTPELPKPPAMTADEHYEQLVLLNKTFADKEIFLYKVSTLLGEKDAKIGELLAKSEQQAPDKPSLIEVFADNGEHSHWQLVDPQTGTVLWDHETAEQQVAELAQAKAKINEYENTELQRAQLDIAADEQYKRATAELAQARQDLQDVRQQLDNEKRKYVEIASENYQNWRELQIAKQHIELMPSAADMQALKAELSSETARADRNRDALAESTLVNDKLKDEIEAEKQRAQEWEDKYVELKGILQAAPGGLLKKIYEKQRELDQLRQQLAQQQPPQSPEEL